MLFKIVLMTVLLGGVAYRSTPAKFRKEKS